MPDNPRDFSNELSTFDLAAPDESWHRFETALPEVFSRPLSSSELEAAFGVFERHPDGESFGLFWTLLHGLEAQPGFERFLVASVRCVPSEFGVTMVGRLLNAGVREVDGVQLRELLSEALQRPDVLPRAKSIGQKFLERNALPRSGANGSSVSRPLLRPPSPRGGRATLPPSLTLNSFGICHALAQT